jgi:molybdopterin-binding protein
LPGDSETRARTDRHSDSRVLKIPRLKPADRLQRRISALIAEVKIFMGDRQITSIIPASSAREMNLKPGQTAAALVKATEV